MARSNQPQETALAAGGCVIRGFIAIESISRRIGTLSKRIQAENRIKARETSLKLAAVSMIEPMPCGMLNALKIEREHAMEPAVARQCVGNNRLNRYLSEVSSSQE
jgi:hypothetical protein